MCARTFLEAKHEGFLAMAAPPRHHSHSAVLRWAMRLGGVGIFFVSVLDASIIPLPIPGSTDLLLLAMTARGANPWILGFAASAGSLVGGYLTWRTGAKGGEVAIKRYIRQRYIARTNRWVSDHGMLAVTVASLLPPPVPLLPFVLAAGALGVRQRDFLVSFGLARTGRYALVAWLGATYGPAIVRLWSHYLSNWGGTIAWVVAGVFVAGIAFAIWKWRQMRSSPVPAQ
jgi:membrane protein YqaA with SNARE-associated domain